MVAKLATIKSRKIFMYIVALYGKPQTHFRFFHFRHIFMITDSWNGSDPDEFEKAFFQTEKCHFLRFLKEGCK